jgi:hypothetical protein
VYWAQLVAAKKRLTASYASTIRSFFGGYLPYTLVLSCLAINSTTSALPPTYAGAMSDKIILDELYALVRE